MDSKRVISREIIRNLPNNNSFSKEMFKCIEDNITNVDSINDKYYTLNTGIIICTDRAEEILVIEDEIHNSKSSIRVDNSHYPADYTFEETILLSTKKALDYFIDVESLIFTSEILPKTYPCVIGSALYNNSIIPYNNAVVTALLLYVNKEVAHSDNFTQLLKREASWVNPMNFEPTYDFDNYILNELFKKRGERNGSNN